MDISTYLTNTDTKQAVFARDIGVPPALVYQWLKGLRPVAAKHCLKIEEKTGGQVTRRELRPDDWQQFWPDLVEPAPAT